MNPGKSNNNQSIVDKLNTILSRIMGKRDDKHHFKQDKPKMSANQKFAAIFFVISFVLWLITGIYYIPENQSAIILHGGKVVEVSNGMKVKIDIPYPFSSVEMIDTSNSNVVVAAESRPINVVNKDLVEQQISAYANYYIFDPKIYFLSSYQDSANLDKQISLIIKEHIQRYFLNLTQNQFSDIGKSVAENEILSQINADINKYGINLNKLTIGFVKLKPEDKKISNSSSGFTDSQLIDEANKYSKWKILQAKQVKDDFDNLLPQYIANPKTISELLYYRMLSSVPESANAEFALLNFTSTSAAESSSFDKIGNTRDLNRQVVRTRTFENR